MKKILLLLIFICSFGFADIGGFDDLKWGASKEEAKNYLIKTFNLEEDDIFETTYSYTKKDGTLNKITYLRIIMGKTSFSGITLRNLSLNFNKHGEFETWTAQTYSISDTKKTKNRLKNEFNLIEKINEEKIEYLRLQSSEESFSIHFLPDKIEFYCTSDYYSFRNLE